MNLKRTARELQPFYELITLDLFFLFLKSRKNFLGCLYSEAKSLTLHIVI